MGAYIHKVKCLIKAKPSFYAEEGYNIWNIMFDKVCNEPMVATYKVSWKYNDYQFSEELSTH